MGSILVSGGTGFIGSHTCAVLLNEGYSLIAADNFSNSSPKVLDALRRLTGRDFRFYEADVTNAGCVEKIFAENDIDGVIHFAAHKAVGESVANPLKYYSNNINASIVLARACCEHGVRKFVFSSSATVYGFGNPPFAEDMPPVFAANPYGMTKVICERILTDTANANKDFSVILLRYFNPVGAHESGMIGEMPGGVPNNLMPYITQVAKGKLKELRIFGDDYDTPDGTCIRDYIHVMDLAEGHTAALKNAPEGVSVYNLGTGRGTSVLELVRAFEAANGIKIPYTIVGRRAGDIAVSYASADKAQKFLGWKAKRTINDMCRDAWNFEKNYGE
ncbi:MAG: UDP-glucose 4-epimerase GalE [Synergistes sp.]|nr:UDP-glucose 4-epimerase GalE [Synergistes sp.]